MFSAVYATVIEWIGGHILEYTTHTRWWDYSAIPFNLDGYVCLGASVTWGVLGVIMLKWLNPLLLALFGLIPHTISAIVLWIALAVLAIDLIGTLLAIAGLRYRWAAAQSVENRLANLTVRGGLWILDHVDRRMARSHPALTLARPKRQKAGTFAAGCSPYKIILLFFIGAFLGDITETIFCRVTGGEWMSRSSVAWCQLRYPPISATIQTLPTRFGTVLTWALCLFMALDMVVSSAALIRYNDRLNGVPAQSAVAEYLDEHYDNDRMHKVYPKAVRTS